jgi:hypothetical protein
VSKLQGFPVADSESKPVRVLGAVGAGLLAVVSGLAAIPGIPGWVPAVVGVFGLGITVGVTKFTERRTTPWETAAAIVNPEAPGELIAGPAARKAAGVAPGYVVEVYSPTSPPERAAEPGDTLPGANWQYPGTDEQGETLRP